MVEGDLDFDMSQWGTLILKYYQLNVQNAVPRGVFSFSGFCALLDGKILRLP